MVLKICINCVCRLNMNAFIWLVCLMSLTVVTHQSDLPNPQSPNPPKNANEWTHPVIFEPQNKTRLTRSCYKVTIFIDFQPILAGFTSVRSYLDSFSKDMNNPAYHFVRQGHSSHSMETSPLFNDTTSNFMRLGKCKNSPYKCAIKIKVDKVKVELRYFEKVFNATYQTFLTAIDHVDYHLMQTKPKIDRPSD